MLNIDRIQAQSDLALRGAAITGDIVKLTELWRNLPNPRLLLLPDKLEPKTYESIIQILLTKTDNKWHQQILGYIYAHAITVDNKLAKYFTDSNFLTSDFWFGYCLYKINHKIPLELITDPELLTNLMPYIDCNLAVTEDNIILAIEYMQPKLLEQLPNGCNFPEIDLQLATVINFSHHSRIQQMWNLIQTKFVDSYDRERFLNYLAIFLGIWVKLLYLDGRPLFNSAECKILLTHAVAVNNVVAINDIIGYLQTNIPVIELIVSEITFQVMQ